MSVCDVPVIAEVCNTVGEGTASLIAAPFDWLAQAMGSAAAWLFESVWAAFDSTTLVDLTARSGRSSDRSRLGATPRAIHGSSSPTAGKTLK